MIDLINYHSSKSLFGLSILVFILIAGPVINLNSVFTIDTSLSLAVITTLISLQNSMHLKVLYCDRILIYIVLFFLCYILFVSIPMSYISNQEIPISRVLTPFKIIFYFISVKFITNKIIKISLNNSSYIIINLIFLSISVNSLFIVYETFSPEFRDFLFIYFKNNIDRSEQIANRAGGLLLSGGAVASGISGIGLLLGFEKLLKDTKSNFTITILLILLNLFAVVLSGRTGILIGFLGLMYLFFYTKHKLKFFLIFTIIGSIIIFIFNNIYDQIILQDNQNLYLSFSRLAIFINGYFGTNYETAFEGDERIEEFLFGSFLLPDNLEQLFFGFISFSNWNYFGKISDMGFQISLMRYGIIGFILYYSAFLFLFYKILINNKNFKLGVVMFISFFLLEIKESTLYARGLIAIMFFTYEISKSFKILKPKLT